MHSNKEEIANAAREGFYGKVPNLAVNEHARVIAKDSPLLGQVGLVVRTTNVCRVNLQFSNGEYCLPLSSLEKVELVSEWKRVES